MTTHLSTRAYEELHDIEPFSVPGGWVACRPGPLGDIGARLWNGVDHIVVRGDVVECPQRLLTIDCPECFLLIDQPRPEDKR